MYTNQIFLIYRQLTNSAASRNGGGNFDRNKLLDHINILWKTKMSMQNYSKLLAQLKDYLSKSGYDKNLQIILSKDWTNFLQKATYTRINTLRRLSAAEFMKNPNDDKTTNVEKHNSDKVENEKVIMKAENKEAIIANLPKNQQMFQVFSMTIKKYFV